MTPAARLQAAIEILDDWAPGRQMDRILLAWGRANRYAGSGDRAAIADLVYRRANLEHAAAEPANLFQAVMLIVLLSLPITAIAGPDIAIWGVHPVSVLLFLAYLAGVRLSATVNSRPMWTPVETRETRRDEPEDAQERHRSARGPALAFVGLVTIMGACGWVISQAGGIFIDRFGLSSSLVGALVTAVVTSLPEFVTTLVAVRRGALQLAVGGIIGGNTFDTLFLPLSDMAYRDGSLYHAATNQDYFWVVTSALMTAILIGGLVVRERRRPAGIGFDSSALLLIYAGAIAVQILAFGGGG